MSKVELERYGNGVALVRLNRPERKNALDDEMFCELLPGVLDEIEEDPAIRVAVFTGAGDAFCSGADFEGCSGWDLDDAAEAEDYIRKTCEVPVRIRTMSKMSIAAVNGPAVGAGFGLALSCDFRIFADDAHFRTPFILMGLGPDFGVSYFLPRLVGIQDALDIMLTGRRVPASEAKELAVAWRTSPHPVEDALEYAALLARQPTRAASVTRRALYQSEYCDVQTEVLVHEARSQGVAIRSSEFMTLFREYRKSLVNG
ncbi:enoyl-CoA hydratase/isomerase family protein [Streptomyces sp. Y7]|uniref:enoyl-CoA hydratase/isomerase family protein n=1 Tax=Streptomyces sp. Y7 TaxID=3342392 RepID=UPI00371DD00C